MASVSFVFLFAAFRGSVFSVSLSDVDVDEHGQQRGLGVLRDACVRRSGEESEEQRRRRREVFSFFFFSENRMVGFCTVGGLKNRPPFAPSIERKKHRPSARSLVSFTTRFLNPLPRERGVVSLECTARCSPPEDHHPPSSGEYNLRPCRSSPRPRRRPRPPRLLLVLVLLLRRRCHHRRPPPSSSSTAWGAPAAQWPAWPPASRPPRASGPSR